MIKNDSQNDALKEVDDHRRGFLSKLLAGSAVAAAFPVMSTVALGENLPQVGGKGKGGKGNGGKGKGGGAAKGKGGSEGTGKGGAANGRRDPKTMAARLIKEFDKDGDGALNAAELEAALKSMMQRRETMGDGASGAGTAGKGKGGSGKGKGKGGQVSPGGGVKPNRPKG